MFPQEVGTAYLDLLDATGDYVVVVDREFRYVAVNRAHAAAHGRTIEELLGHTVAELMGPAVFDRVLRPHYEAALAGEVVRMNGWFALSRAGTRYYNVTFGPCRGTEGECIGVVVIVRDLTERERAADSLRRSQERLTFALSAARMGIWEWDVVNDTLDWSDQLLELFGTTREQFDGTYEAFLSRLHPDDLGTVTAAVARALEDPAAGSRYGIEYRVLMPDGGLRWQHAKGSVLRDEAGRPLRMVGTVSDVSERKSMEAQLRVSQKLEAVGRLAGGIAHDFNNILAGMVGEAGLALEHGAVPSEVGESLRAIIGGSRRAAELTRRLLTVARMQPVVLVPTDLNAVVSDMGVLLRWTLRDTMALELRLHQPLSPVMADASQIEQLVLNLAINAREAATKNGRVLISTSLVAGPDGHECALLAFEDDGPGIPESIIDHVFEPFFTTKKSGGNSGMGLAICYGIVQRLGGSIRVARPAGRGCRFEILLRALADASIERANPRLGGEPRGAEHVLLAEDDPWVRQVVAAQIASLGYRVTACEGGAEALQAFTDADHVDIVVSDVMMPGMSGPELCNALVARAPNLAVLYISGRAMDLSDADSARRLLPKPFTRSELAVALRKALDPPAPDPPS